MNKFMRKIGVSICLMAAMGMAAGCGNSGTQSNSSQSDAPNDQSTTKKQTAEDKVYTIGMLQFADHASLDNCREGFIQGLKESGFAEGKNLKIDLNNATADTGNANLMASGYAEANVDLICAIATPAAQAAYNAAEAKKIPVIYTAVSDPIGAGLAPAEGANSKLISGTSDELPLEKQVAMIRELLPEAKTIGIIYSTSEVNSETQIAKLNEIVPKYGFTLVTSGINASADIPLAVDNLLTKVDCINNLTDNTVVSALNVILEKANAKAIPVFGSEEEQVKLGCVASESINYIDLGIQTGKMAAKVLNGEDITTLPYETIAASEFVINKDAMEKLGISVPTDGRDVSVKK